MGSATIRLSPILCFHQAVPVHFFLPTSHSTPISIPLRLIQGVQLRSRVGKQYQMRRIWLKSCTASKQASPPDLSPVGPDEALILTDTRGLWECQLLTPHAIPRISGGATLKAGTGGLVATNRCGLPHLSKTATRFGSRFLFSLPFAFFASLYEQSSRVNGYRINPASQSPSSASICRYVDLGETLFPLAFSLRSNHKTAHPCEVASFSTKLSAVAGH